MSFKCPYTEICRAEALRQFAEVPELAAIFSQRLQCSERDVDRAHRCAQRLELTEKEFPTLGVYIRDQRRARDVSQRTLAQQVSMSIQELRDLELNKLDLTDVSRQILEGIAKVLSAPAEYLVSLAKITARSSGASRQGMVFARTVLLDDEDTEHK